MAWHMGRRGDERNGISRLLGFCLALIGFSAVPASSRPGMAERACDRVVFEGDGFVVCRYAHRADRLRLLRRDKDGHPGSMAELEAALGAEASQVRFAVNAGMYHPDYSPVGLYIANGRIERPLERGDGAGNFYLRPNGVFWIDGDGQPHVHDTETFAAGGFHPYWATQSGPLLFDAGALHPAISENGPSRTLRNAVGIADGQALFVISEGSVSFGRLARFLRDRLGCRDALYLDGTVSSLWAPELGRKDRRADLGTFLVVLRR